MMTKEDLIKLVKKICIADFENETQYINAIFKFKENVPDPQAANLVFRHKPQLTPEEIVEKALAYKPIILPPPADLNVKHEK